MFFFKVVFCFVFEKGWFSVTKAVLDDLVFLLSRQRERESKSILFAISVS